MEKKGLSFSLLFLFLAVVVGVLLAWPQPELDMEGYILPLARNFMGLSDTTTTTPLEGLVVVITGTTSGIGKSLTRSLTEMGATVVAMGRSPSKLEQLQKEMIGGGKVVPVVADLNDLSSVSKAADEIAKQFESIDVLVNNAGMHYGWSTWSHPATVQGHDRSFGVNYLSHFLLTEKLLPSLATSERATIVQISSSYHWAVDGSDLVVTDGKPPVASIAAGSSSHLLLARDQRAYANSKLAQILHSRALTRHNNNSIRVVNVCPAWVGTQIAGTSPLMKYTFQSIAFPSNGWGIASTLVSMLDNNKTLPENDFFINSKVFAVFSRAIPETFFQPWFTVFHLRDALSFVIAYTLLPLQKFAPEAFPHPSSPESYNVTLQDSLYQWSKGAVKEWL